MLRNQQVSEQCLRFSATLVPFWNSEQMTIRIMMLSAVCRAGALLLRPGLDWAEPRAEGSTAPVEPLYGNHTAFHFLLLDRCAIPYTRLHTTAVPDRHITLHRLCQ